MTARAAVAAILFVLAAAPALGQTSTPPPVSFTPWISFLPRYDFHLSASALTSRDKQFDWDAHFGGEVDVIDYRLGRLIFTADYNVVMGHELRSFDPTQGNYVLELSGSRRYKHVEVHGRFHHTSRHLADRPKKEAIDWNALGVRATREETWRRVRLREAASIERVIMRSFVDYTWLFTVETAAEFPVRGPVMPIGQARLVLRGVDREVANRGAQTGFYIEGGARIHGVKAALEFFGAVERRIDAEPLGREAKSWALFGFRIVNRD